MMVNERRWAHAPWPLLVVLIAAIGALALRSPTLLSRARLNGGYAGLNQALAEGDESDYAGTASALNRLAGDPSLHHQAQRALGLLYMAQSRPEEAIAAWQTVEGSAGEAQQWGNRAERGQDFATAGHWYRLAARLDPQNGDHWYRLAHALAEVGDGEAYDDYLVALSAAQRSEFGPSNILTRLGELEKGAGEPDWEAVWERFDEALERNDFTDQADVITARLGRAEALERRGEYAASLAEYRRLIDDEPGLYWANVHGGRLTWAVERDAPTAIALLRHAIEINDKVKWAYLNLGLVYAGSGQADLAIPLFQQTLKIDPNDQESRRQLEQLIPNDS